jgi:hypothetical protein
MKEFSQVRPCWTILGSHHQECSASYRITCDHHLCIERSMQPLLELLALKTSSYHVVNSPNLPRAFAFIQLRAIPRHLLPQPRIQRRAPCCSPERVYHSVRPCPWYPSTSCSGFKFCLVIAIHVRCHWFCCYTHPAQSVPQLSEELRHCCIFTQ